MTQIMQSLILFLTFFLILSAIILYKAYKINNLPIIICIMPILFYFAMMFTVALQFKNYKVPTIFEHFKQKFQDPPNPPKVFAYIQTVNPEIPTPAKVFQTFSDCVKQGNEIKGCMTSSSVALYPELCSDMCQEIYGKQDLAMGIYGTNSYCSTLCSELMRQQRDSSSSGPA